MKIITKKIGVLILVICCILFGATALFAVQISQPTVAQANESEIAITDYDSTAPIEVIATVEEELQGQGTSIHAVLQSQRSTYIEKLNSALGDEKETIISIIATLDEAITGFGGNAFTLAKTSNFNAVKTNGVSTYSNGLSPNCTCSTSLVIPCGNCDFFMNTCLAVVAIAAGFETRGWGLAADLMLFNKSNRTMDVEYWPSLGNQIIAAPQIAEVALNNCLADSSSQASPSRLSGLFASTIEGDMYNSLGSFYYTKKNVGNGNVDLDIIDRYDWTHKGGVAGVFNDTLAMAQEIGVVTPFYTRINFTMPGYVPYDWEYTNDGVAVTGVASDITIAEIPYEIKDLRIKPKDEVDQPEVNITSIGDNAFANNTNITEIILLDKVEDGIIKEKTRVSTIGNSAFSGCSNLTAVSDLVNVTYIGDNAFYNCKELASVTLPKISYLGDNAFAECSKLAEVAFGTNDVLETIRERAFYNTGLRNFTIPTNVTNIEDEAFFGTTITSFEGNLNYVWQDNVLIQYNVSNLDKKIAVYVNPTLSSITFPNSVAILNSKLFKNNANINTVYLNQVEHIGPEAFRSSSLTNLHNSDNIIDCDKTALLDTPWYNSLNEFIILGKVLLEYRGTESVVKIPNNVYRIGAECFNNNFTTQVVLSDQIDSLGYASLSGLASLESVIFTSDFPPILDGDCFSDNVILYVKESRLVEYQNNISFINLPNTITKKEIQISFYDIDNNSLGSKTEYYGSKFDDFISAPTIKGKDFCGWKYNGFKLKTNDMIDSYDNLELIADYEAAAYQISIIGEDGNQNLVIEYGQQISLPIPSEAGKNFIGWYDQNEGGNLIVDSTGECVWERTIDNDTLYPRFENISYKITYEGNKLKEFTVDNPINNSELESPQRFGYIFAKWNYNNQQFTSTTGIFTDIVLVAEWKGKTIYSNQSLTITDEIAIVDMTSISTRIVLVELSDFLFS